MMGGGRVYAKPIPLLAGFSEKFSLTWRCSGPRYAPPLKVNVMRYHED